MLVGALEPAVAAAVRALQLPRRLGQRARAVVQVLALHTKGGEGGAEGV